MNLLIPFTLDEEIELETNSNHGNVEHIWLAGRDWANTTTPEFVMALIGEKTYQHKLAAMAFAQAENEWLADD